MKPTPVKIFSDIPELCCEYCGKNLLDADAHGNYLIFKTVNDKYACIKYACKEHDHIVTDNAKMHNLKYAGWEDVDDMLIPTIWIKRLMAFMNELFGSHQEVTPQYFDDTKKLLLNTFPYITRGLMQEEQERVSTLLSIEF